MEVFLRFNYNGKPLTTDGKNLILGIPEHVIYVNLDEPVSELLKKIDETILFEKTRGFISDITKQVVKQVKPENKSLFSMFGTTEYDMLQSTNKLLKEVLTLEPGKRVILDVKVGSPYAAQGGRRKSRKNKRV